ncbi:helix-turn-helix transcriptional regulator [Paenibacillus alba]|uniref:YafY family protein n=1 Tax=Paenibacillus alba TaxID=1197127 RepID=A0ABU6G1P7_9BACL|nr:YafY family protein [Paenibacillus alba]MEC0227187.1 YafY family protein [Paenibacillus alba]NQX67691.1 YafY family transcriptional regulator [Paenibacillus alba]
MNKTDRLLAIVLELQSKGTLRAEDLADTFETSRRTIYRDIQALSEAGVPVVGSTGIGYSLMEGYFLPPLSFTIEEAVSLLIGTDFVVQKFDSSYGAKAQTAQSKIETILPERILDEVHRIRKTTKVVDPNLAEVSYKEKEYLAILRQVILTLTKVQFQYSKIRADTESHRHLVRKVAPYGLILINGSWVLIAFCELRQEIRHFRLSRMSDLIVTTETFLLPAEFNLQNYKTVDDRNIHVRMLAKQGIANRIKESNNFYLEEMAVKDEQLELTFRVRQIEDILSWVLSWGSDIVVMEPESLRIRVREEIELMSKSY